MRTGLSIRLAIGLLWLVVAAGACDDSQAPVPPKPEAGPLAVLVEPGVSSIYAPSRTPWAGVFGDFLLCVRDGETAYLDSVDYAFEVEPLDTPRAVVRVLEEDQNTTATAVGTLDQLSAGPKKLAGQFHPVEGFDVETKCDQANPPEGDELLVGLNSGPEGAWVRYATVKYHDEQQRAYEVRIPWQMIMCGSSIESPAGQSYCT